MDPRHPERTLPRVKELIAQYERVENDIKAATTNTQIAKLEREGGLVIREISFVAPRLHERLMKVARDRRGELSRGLIFPQPVVVGKLVETELEKEVEKAIEIPTPPNQAETEIAVIKPRKKKTKKAKK